MWAAFLRRQNEAPGPQQALLEYGTLVTCVSDRGIDDAAWLAEPGTTTGEEETAEDLDHDGHDDEPADDHGLSEVGA
jgi:hypothetical protein